MNTLKTCLTKEDATNSIELSFKDLKHGGLISWPNDVLTINTMDKPFSDDPVLVAKVINPQISVSRIKFDPIELPIKIKVLDC